MAKGDDVGSLDQLIMAENVTLDVSDVAYSGTGAKEATNTFVNLLDLSISKTFPQNRIDHGKKRDYLHSVPDIAISFSLSGSSGIFAALDLRAKLQPNSRQLPKFLWKFTTSSGTSRTSDNEIPKNYTVEGKLMQFSVTKPRGGSGTTLEMSCTVQLTDDDIAIA